MRYLIIKLINERHVYGFSYNDVSNQAHVVTLDVYNLGAPNQATRPADVSETDWLLQYLPPVIAGNGFCLYFS